MIVLLIPLAFAGATGVLALSRKKPTNNSGSTVDVNHGHGARPDIASATHPKGAINVRALAARAGAPAIWQDFFEFTAFGESGLRTAVGLGSSAGAPPWAEMHTSKGEVAASVKGYNNNEAWLKPCWPKGAYTFGSGGLFALLPSSALSALKGTPYACAHPWSIFDPSAAMIYAAGYAHRIQGWSNYQSTVLSMRVGWGNPSAMGKTPDPKKVAKWGDHCEAVGLSRSFLDETLPAWTPPPADELWSTMGVDNGWLPGQKAS